MSPVAPVSDILTAGLQVTGACAVFVATIAAGEQLCQRINARLVVRSELRHLRRSTSAGRSPLS